MKFVSIKPSFHRTYKISKRKKSNIVYLYITKKNEIVNKFLFNIDNESISLFFVK